MTPEEVWRQKSDGTLLAAAERLEDYTDDGQRAIVAELERRRAAGTIDEAAGTMSLLAAGSVDAAAGSVDAAAGSPASEFPTRVLVPLWRGHVPLSRTYWGWGMAGGLAMAVVVAIADAIGLLWLQLVVALFAVAYSVVITVAIWRSAGRYEGPQIWGHLARIAVAMSIARTVVEILF